jgi:tRNA (mo5U34)-methyltransferase
MIELDQVDCIDKVQLTKAVESKVWFHSINLGNGIVTKGQKTEATILQELAVMRLPDVKNKTVLDIGAFDGFYSFEVERRGASRVVALDLQMWELETLFSKECLEEHAREGKSPNPPYKTEWLRWERDSKGLPGKKKFDLVRRALGSKVEPYVGDFVLTGPEHIGMYDVVLFLGVLYHLQEPLAAIKRVASLTKEVAIIETEAVAMTGFEDRAVCEFFPTNELNGDYSNWWSPNLKAIIGMCTAAGFSRVDVIQGPPVIHANAAPDDGITRYRAILHAWK